MRIPESLQHLVALLWPHRCLVCGRSLYRTQLCSRCEPNFELSNQGVRCVGCWSELLERPDGGGCAACRLFSSPFRYQRYLSPYSGAIGEIIRIVKYRPSRRLCGILAKRVTGTVREIFPLIDWDLIVPLPATARSFAQRGFNQCDIIAHEIARVVGITYRPSALSHRGSRYAQASLPHERRIGNVQRSFSAREHIVRGKRILLVDDVTTTGATSAAAGHALLDGGAVTVDLFTLARGDAWGEYRGTVHQRIGGRGR